MTDAAKTSNHPTGAETLIETLVNCGVDLCFTNPGTSEMHLVAAIDKVPGMRPVLGLFEGVVTGAADGYARMTGKPAATLLHLGPGLANGIANLHNARRAGSSIVNIVGDHATYHQKYDAPLASDIHALAGTFSSWVKSAPDAASLAPLGAQAVSESLRSPGNITTLIVPADTAWDAARMAAKPLPAPAMPKVAASDIEKAAKAISGAKKPAILIGGPAMYEDGLYVAGQIAKKTGAALFSDTFNKRIERGAGRVFATTIPYFGEMALDALTGVDLLVIIGTKAPIAFFAYPGKPSMLVPEGCETLSLCDRDADVLGALTDLADEVGAIGIQPDVQKADRPNLPPAGALTSGTIGHSLGALLPEGAIVVDEGVSNGIASFILTLGCPHHDWMNLTGGAIGMGLPLATGAALGAPDRKVICLEGDGSGMYTVQALWTQARENLDVTTIIFANRTYNILNVEFERTGSGEPGDKANSMLSIGDPNLDWVKIANGMGVEAVRVDTAEGFTAALAAAMAQKGPRLIEAIVP